jgi:hypothetical protein
MGVELTGAGITDAHTVLTFAYSGRWFSTPVYAAAKAEGLEVSPSPLVHCCFHLLPSDFFQTARRLPRFSG